MFSLLRQWFLSFQRGSFRTGNSARGSSAKGGLAKGRSWRTRSLIGALSLVLVGTSLSLMPSLVTAQTSVQQQENRVIREFTLPRQSAPAPVYRPRQAPATTKIRRAPQPSPTQRPAQRPASSTPAATSRGAQPASPPAPSAQPTQPSQPEYQYVLEFNRSPVVGNRLRMEGVYPEARLGFTRPRNWQTKTAKLVLRFQHSPSLLADRSSLVVRVNDTSIGSIPLNRPKSQIGQVVLNIPPNLIQDYNDIAILAEQQTSETCTIPTDPTLWTEILPDSKIVLDYEPQNVPLDFSRYPYPLIDQLSLDPNQLTYLRPSTYSETWLNAAALFQADAGRMVDFRPLNTRLTPDLDNLKWNDRLVVIGTPAEQPLLSQLSLPFPVKSGQILDGNNSPLPPDVGVLMLTTVKDGGNPVLVATGNSGEGVLKAVQFLVQTQDSQIGTGQAITVTSLTEAPALAPRAWPGYLPTNNRFNLRELTMENRQPFEDTTVRGTNAPSVQIPFKSLPDDRFSRGSTMNLQYSYSSQVDPRTSTVEVRLDDVTIGSKRLNSSSGKRESLNVDLPPNLIQPDSALTVFFNLNPRQSEVCGLSKDQSLWGTVHSDTRFDLKRDIFVQMPDLKLLQTGYPFTAPQDLSEMAIALPESPKDSDVVTMLAFTERMGRLSQADGVRLQVYRGGNLPAEVKNEMNLVGIGTRDRFPFPEVFEAQNGFSLGEAMSRQWNGNKVQSVSDNQGVLKMIISPENSDRVILALTGQSEQGLRDVGELFDRNQLFSQLQSDTILINRNQPNPSPDDPFAYSLDFLKEVQQQRVQKTGFLSRISLFIQDYWFLLPAGIVMLSLLLYGVSQLYVNRLANSGDAK